jgi:hypothetical protein
MCRKGDVGIVIGTVLHLGNCTFIMARFLTIISRFSFVKLKVHACLIPAKKTDVGGHFNAQAALSPRKEHTQKTGWMDPTANPNVVVRRKVLAGNSKKAPLVQPISLVYELSAFICL